MKVFLFLLLDDGRIRSRIRTCDYRIREAQKHTDPDTDPDPQHWKKYVGKMLEQLPLALLEGAWKILYPYIEACELFYFFY